MAPGAVDAVDVAVGRNRAPPWRTQCPIGLTPRVPTL